MHSVSGLNLKTRKEHAELLAKFELFVVDIRQQMYYYASCLIKKYLVTYIGRPKKIHSHFSDYAFMIQVTIFSSLRVYLFFPLNPHSTTFISF